MRKSRSRFPSFGLFFLLVLGGCAAETEMSREGTCSLAAAKVESCTGAVPADFLNACFSASDAGAYEAIGAMACEELGIGEFVSGFRPGRLCPGPATELAVKHVGRPLPNAALLGGFAAVTGLLELESVAAAIRDKFSGRVAESNVAAARAAWEIVRQEMKEAASHAQAS